MRILISCRTLEGANNNQFLFDSIERGMYSLFKGHSITALLNRPQDFEELAKDHDLLVLSGGDDHPRRLITEIEAIKNFRLLDKPILGICHGAFLLTQLMDGECVDVNNHRACTHRVMYKYTERIVNSYHGSAIVKAPEGADVLVTDDDEYIESWIHKNIMAIVWHPERDETHWMPEEIKNTIGV